MENEVIERVKEEIYNITNENIRDYTKELKNLTDTLLNLYDIKYLIEDNKDNKDDKDEIIEVLNNDIDELSKSNHELRTELDKLKNKTKSKSDLVEEYSKINDGLEKLFGDEKDDEE